MLVTTNAPIVEESSSANGKRRTRQKGQFGKQATEKFRSGYTRLKEAGGLPVIENLLGLGQGTTTNTEANFMPPPPPPPPPPTGMSTTTKVVIGVLVVGAIAGAIYYFTKVKGKTAKK
jgi:hypothetical protein